MIDEEATARGGRLGLVIDVGSGQKPYAPWLADRCTQHIGVDLDPRADVQSGADALPFDDEVADLVLSTQVLEHVADPSGSVSEMGRITRPGSLVVASTHGVQPYHPTPTDYWRWTGAGLEKLFIDSGRFSSVTVLPCGGTIGCITYLLALYTSLIGDRLRQRGLAGRVASGGTQVVVATINLIGATADQRWRKQQDPTRANTMSANFVVLARR